MLLLLLLGSFSFLLVIESSIHKAATMSDGEGIKRKDTDRLVDIFLAEELCTFVVYLYVKGEASHDY
jgi:hypothetical protein